MSRTERRFWERTHAAEVVQAAASHGGLAALMALHRIPSGSRGALVQRARRLVGSREPLPEEKAPPSDTSPNLARGLLSVLYAAADYGQACEITIRLYPKQDAPRE